MHSLLFHKLSINLQHFMDFWTVIFFLLKIKSISATFSWRISKIVSTSCKHTQNSTLRVATKVTHILNHIQVAIKTDKNINMGIKLCRNSCTTTLQISIENRVLRHTVYQFVNVNLQCLETWYDMLSLMYFSVFVMVLYEPAPAQLLSAKPSLRWARSNTT